MNLVSNLAKKLSSKIGPSPDQRNISAATSFLKTLPVVNNLYSEKLNRLERGLLESNLVGDTYKLNMVSDPADKLFLKGAIQVGKIINTYDKIVSTPGVENDLYKSNFSGGKIRRITRRRYKRNINKSVMRKKS
jgi:hypothetical protein